MQEPKNARLEEIREWAAATKHLDGSERSRRGEGYLRVALAECDRLVERAGTLETETLDAWQVVERQEDQITALHAEFAVERDRLVERAEAAEAALERVIDSGAPLIGLLRLACEGKPESAADYAPYASYREVVRAISHILDDSEPDDA